MVTSFSHKSSHPLSCFCTTMFKIQRVIKSIILYLKASPGALDNTILMKVKKPLEMCLSFPFVLIVTMSFYGKIENIAVSVLCCPLEQTQPCLQALYTAF